MSLKEDMERIRRIFEKLRQLPKKSLEEDMRLVEMILCALKRKRD